jgi:hypothetical protein
MYHNLILLKGVSLSAIMFKHGDPNSPSTFISLVSKAISALSEPYATQSVDTSIHSLYSPQNQVEKLGDPRRALGIAAVERCDR